MFSENLSKLGLK